MDTKQKRVVISCGPIPARLDSVKFITNRFKGGLAFKTAQSLIDDGYDTTVITWIGTSIPEVKDDNDYWSKPNVHIVKVLDVVEYYNWFKDNAANYDAFVLAGAVANLMPSNPWEGKFPSHKYQVSDKFDIRFEIAPRAIDIIKQVNPRACLIGYKLFDGTEEELLDAARLTQRESKANIIFANTPATAKEKKLAVMADNSVVPCTFDEHIELMKRQIDSLYFKTEFAVLPKDDPNVREALAVVKMYEQTFDGFGTVAVPVKNGHGWFATTSRGHKGEPVLVFHVNNKLRTVTATGKATLNAPTLAAALNGRDDVIVVHRHDDDPLFSDRPFDVTLDKYLFPGTIEEVNAIHNSIEYMNNALVGTDKSPRRIKLFKHGDLSILPIESPNWNKYYEQFPDRYFKSPIDDLIPDSDNSLEVGANKTSKATYVYDKYVKCDTSINLTEDEVFEKYYDLVYIKNAINYLPLDFLKRLVPQTNRFIANTFMSAPNEKITELEAVITTDKIVHHNLRLKDDTLVRHEFLSLIHI